MAADHLTVAFEAVNPLAMLVRLFGQVRPQACAVEFIFILRGQFRPHDVCQSWQHVRQVGNDVLLALNEWRLPRCVDNKRDMHAALLFDGGLPAFGGVVGSEDDDGVFQFAHRLKFVDVLPHLIVEVFDLVLQFIRRDVLFFVGSTERVDRATRRDLRFVPCVRLRLCIPRELRCAGPRHVMSRAGHVHGLMTEV